MLSYNFDLICVLLSHVHQQHCDSLPSSHLPLSCAHLSADQEKELWMRADSLGHLLSLLPVSAVEWGGVGRDELHYFIPSKEGCSE